MSKFRARLTYANVMATIAAVAALGALGGPVAAEPIADTATSVGKKIARALKLSKGADKRSKEALKLARRVQQQGGQGSQGAQGSQGTQGAKGDKGDKGDKGSPGSDAQFNGAAAGGSLTGTYPDPSIKNDAVTGAQIQNLGVGPQDLANGAVTASKLGTLTIRTASVILDSTGQVEGNGSYDTLGVQKDCNFGEQPIAVGGGWGLPTTGTRPDEELITTNMGFMRDVTTSRPTGGHARVGNDTSASYTFTLQVVCLSG